MYQSAVADLGSPTLSGNSTVVAGENLSLTGSAGSGGTGSYKYSYTTTGGTLTGSGQNRTFNCSTPGTYTVTYKITDSAISGLYKTATKNITVIPKLTKPTVSSISVNSGDNAVFTVSNHDTISGEDAGVTYKLFKGSTELTAGTDYTYSSGTFTITGATDANAGTYKVQAISSDTTTHGHSDKSSGATLTVYSPKYCLVGNVNREALILDGSPTPFTPTNPENDATWWNTWQSGLTVSTATDTPGKYKIKFTVNPDCDRDEVNLGIYLQGVGQKAFILNGVAYNTSAHGDITITDAGITDANNLYAYDLAATNAGGSLVLKKGQTYTIYIDQTQKYNVSSPVGKITIEASDYFAETVAKKQSYNPTERTWNTISDAATTIGTVSSTPLHSAKPSFSTLLTAKPVNAHYDFIGWYTDEACTTGEIPAASCTPQGDGSYTTTVTVNDTITYYALFKQKQPDDVAITVIQEGSDQGTITITDGAATDNTTSDTTAYPGATVSVSADPADDPAMELSYWKIINSNTLRDVTSQVMTNATANNSSFVMPSYPVTLTAVFRERTPITVNISSNDTGLGTAARGDALTYYVGDSGIPIVATPVDALTGGAFVKWQISGGTLASATSASTTFTATAANVTIRAIFENKTYQLYYGTKKLPMLRQSNGKYVSTATVTGTTAFTIYNKTDNKYARSRTGTGDYELNTPDWLSHIFEADWNASSPANYKYKLNSGISSNSYYVVFDPTAGTYGGIQIVAANPIGTIAQIYAKDGSIRYSSDGNTSGDLHDNSVGGPTCNRGETVITKIDDTKVTDPNSSKYPSTGLSDHLKMYSAPIGSTITIQTTVNADYKTKGFYVGMFVVNGWKVPATDRGSGVYTATYTLSEDYAVDNLQSEKSFEITPVYYNTNFEYVTFYVDAKSVPSTWGNTISACANYDGAAKPHFEGTYPGQPLGREGDLYEIKVSKYYYDYADSTWTRHPNYQPAATITAYNYDVVHHRMLIENDDTLDSGNKNYQTYDYSDFAYLAKIKNIEAILFRCMRETAETNRNSTVNSTSTIDTSGVRPDDDDVNTYHLLTDYYGNPIDALGNRISNGAGGYYTAEDAANWTEDDDAQIKIVSYGNISNDKKKSDTSTNVAYKNWRTKGNWITAWKVFDASAQTTPIAVGSPADFVNINANTDQSALYGFTYFTNKSSTDLAGKITFISYEAELDNNKDLSGETNTGKRIDGQWYYSAQHPFDSTVEVAELKSAGATNATLDGTAVRIVTEANTNSGSETTMGYLGATSGSLATLDDVTTKTYDSVTSEADLKVTVGSGYMFVGWYLKDGTSYVKIHDNYADINTTLTMKKNYTIVALVKQVPEGSLVITHSRYTGNKPSAHDGTGKYYISAVVTHSNNSTTSIPEAQNAITIPGLASTDKLTITIRTVCNGDDTFYAWYEEVLGDSYARTGSYYEICDENVDPLDQKEVSYTFFNVKCDKFFDGETLSRKSIDFYSDVTHVSAFANITYKYYDRFDVSGAGQMASYTVKDIELSPEEIDAGYIPSDATIAKYAPDVIDTIYKDTKWVITDIGNRVQRLPSNVTVMATQNDKDCYVQYVPYDEVDDEIIGSGDVVSVYDVATWSNIVSPYNGFILNDGADQNTSNYEDFLIKAPATITKNGTTYNFVRFDVYSISDRVSNTIGTVIFSCNDDAFGYRIFTDCVIYPVYSAAGSSVVKELTATIEPAVLNREVYDSGSGSGFIDKLYADIIIAYINLKAVSSDLPIAIKDNDPDVSGFDIESGLIVDRAKILSDDDYNYLTECAQQGLDDVTQDLILEYSDYDSVFSTDDVETLMTAGSASATYSDTNSKTHTLTKYVNTTANLTNKNRIDKVLRFNNSEAARKYIFAAYSYIVIRNHSTNEVVRAVRSDPQFFNFCYVGSKPTEADS